MELTAANASPYLASRGIGAKRISTLPGGVSNIVLFVETDDYSFVLKQSLAKLRVKDNWEADRSRIFREMESLSDVAAFLPRGSVPQVLWADRENYLFAMSAVDGQPWKHQIFAGQLQSSVSREVGRLLGLFIQATWEKDSFRRKYGDQAAFVQLRIDPYYRSVALRHPHLACRVKELIEESSSRRVALVHGDWSPKNILVAQGRLTLIDFEVVHFGDPSFDAAFCLNHLLLKFLCLPSYASDLEEMIGSYWRGLTENLPVAASSFFEGATLRHLGCLMLARLDGKSPVEYVVDEGLRHQIRQAAMDLILDCPHTVAQVLDRLPNKPDRPSA